MMFGQPVEVLLVEDDPGDVDLTREMLSQEKVVVNLHVVVDGVEALAYLRREGHYHDAVRPDIVLLDLNMPRKDGREVLHDLKQDDRLKIIPVVVLTTSDAERDVLKSYELGANCYVTKPVGLTQFAHIVSSIEDFWFTVVRLPARHA
jgi:two-component system, chemotaxis family, response regulator Rcp1